MSSLVTKCGASIIIGENRSWVVCRLYRKRGSLSSDALKKGSRPFVELIANAEKKPWRSRKWTWWQNLFSDKKDDGWFGSSGMDVFEDDEADGLEEASDDERFEAWKNRVEAISDIREAQEGSRNSESREWEDWLGNGASWDQELGDNSESSNKKSDDPIEVVDVKGFFDAIQGLVSASDNNEEVLFEDRVFRYAWANSAKFVGLLVLIPCVFSFLVHSYILMPFLDRYVKTVPLAAEMLDVRRHQKLDMIKTLKLDEARFRFEVEIGKSPPLSDEELWLEMRHKAIELRDEKRLENRHAFANILSDMVYGIVLFILIYANQSKVALLKFVGYKLLDNISDTGKAFLIILTTDIFLGYHSESGWQVLVEVLLERYGLEVDQAAITIFICTIPVVIDACVKLWLFKFLPKLSPNVTNIFQEMKRH